MGSLSLLRLGWMGLNWRREMEKGIEMYGWDIEMENEVGRSRWKGRKWELFWVGGGCMGCEGGGGKVRFKVIILTLKRVQKGRL